MNGFKIFIAIYFLILIFAIGFIVVNIVMKVRNNVKNSKLPIVTDNAIMITKRISHSRAGNSGDNYYLGREKQYATFEFESGDRLELSIIQSEYGLLRDGDFGKLTFQGTRFISFERIKN